MSDSPETEDNHLVAVGNLLFDGAKTEEQHLEVIERGLGERPSGNGRAMVVDYAREHLSGASLIDVQLTVAEKAVEDIELVDEYDRGDRQRHRNTPRVNEALSLLMEVADAPALGADDYGRVWGLIAKVQKATPGREYGVDSDDNPFVLDPSERPGRLAQLGSGVLAAAVEKFDPDWAAELKKRTSASQKFGYTVGITELASRFIDRTEAELDDPEEVLGSSAYGAYMQQARWVANVYSSTYQRPDSVQSLIDGLVDRAVAHIDVDMPDAVKACLALHNEGTHQGKGSLQYSDRKGALNKALQITRDSDREPVVRERRSFWGFTRRTTEPSQFEARRRLLEGQLTNNFYHYLDKDPDFISDVLGLYDQDSEQDRESATELWYAYAAMLADRSFTNGHYNPAEIQGIQDGLSRFSRVAPVDAATWAHKAVRDRLARSTAASQYI